MFSCPMTGEQSNEGVMGERVCISKNGIMRAYNLLMDEGVAYDSRPTETPMATKHKQGVDNQDVQPENVEIVPEPPLKKKKESA